MSVREFEPIYLTLEEHPDALIVGFTVPRLSEDVNLEQLGHELFALVEQYGCRKLVVSLRDVIYLTSSGLGKMITLHRKMHRLQGEVVFFDLNETVDEILRASKLDTYLKLAPDRETALRLLHAG